MDRRENANSSMPRRAQEKYTVNQATGSQVSAEEQNQDIDFVELVYVLIEKLKWIILAAVLGAIIAGAYSILIVTPKYTATAKLYVLNSKDTAINLSDLQIGSYLAKDYQEVFKNALVHQAVIKKLGLNYNEAQLVDMLEITNPSDTRVLYITVEAPSREDAKNIADAYAEVSQEFIVATMETEKPNIFEPARLPQEASSPNKIKNVALGFLLGVFLAIVIIFIRFISDDRIRTSEEIEKYMEGPCLGIMPLQTMSRRQRK